MRVVYLLTQDLSSPSGLGRYFPWAKELVRIGFDVRVVALHPDYSNLLRKNTTVEGVKVEYVGQMHVKKSGNTKSYFSPILLIGVAILGTLKLTLRALTDRMDVLIIGKPHPMNSIAALVVRLIWPNIKIILDCDDFETGSNRFQAKWQKKVVAWFESIMPKKAQVVTSNTYYTLNRLKSLGIPQEKLVYLPNGIDEDRFGVPNSDEVETVRMKLGLIGKKVVSFIGSMSLTNHPVDLLLHAFKILHVEIPDSFLLLVGSGEDLHVLQDLSKALGIDKSTYFVGRVLPDQVPLYYALSDVTVDPVHDNEAARGRCPLKLFESWACGVPFVTGDVGDRKTLLSSPQTGILTKTGDPTDLAKAITTILLDRELANNLIESGRNKVKDYYWSILHEKIQNIY